MNSMHVRDFVRGGYKELTEPTIITKHNRPIGTWIPPWTNFSVVTKAERKGESSSR